MFIGFLLLPNVQIRYKITGDICLSFTNKITL
mgnify:CR=1 FL=1